MKRFLFVAISLFIWLGALAQESKQLININPESFRPVQTDVLTGVNIDPIAKDRSQRACARIKLHVNRMTREEIDQLQVVIAGGNVALTKKVTSFEGNGLIIEMTAKPQTRFHIHHDKYGDSNQVTVDLEGNKVYLLNAQLDLLLPITVASNVKGADVYIDGAYKGKTGEDYMCAIADVIPGSHTIKIQHGAAFVEREVDVNSENFSFRVEVNTKSQAQFVLFQIEPKNAVVMIDNHPYIANDGYVQVTLNNGTYQYLVMADGYHSKSDKFTVSGSTVNLQVKLQPDAAMVTITSGDGAEIWINGERKGLSPWKGLLNSGTYRFEARKANHESVTMSQTITSEVTEQLYVLEAPKPMLGTLALSSTPPMADITIDGQSMGQTPKMIELLVGKHRVSLYKPGYEFWTQDVVIEQSKTIELMTKLKPFGQDSQSNVVTTEPKSKPSKEPKPAKEPKPVKEPKPKPVKEPKSKPVKAPQPVAPVKVKYEQSVSLGSDIDLGSDKLVGLGLNYIGGCRIGNGFFIGGGTGLDFVVKDDAGKNYEYAAILKNNLTERYCPAPSKLQIPLYLHMRTYMGKKSCQPFFALSGGIKIGLKGKPELHLHNDSGAIIHAQPYSPVNGFVEPAFGLNFRTKKSASFYMQMGGLIQMRPYYRPLNSTQGALSRKMSGGLTIKVGCTF